MNIKTLLFFWILYAINIFFSCLFIVILIFADSYLFASDKVFLSVLVILIIMNILTLISNIISILFVLHPLTFKEIDKELNFNYGNNGNDDIRNKLEITKSVTQCVSLTLEEKKKRCYILFFCMLSNIIIITIGCLIYF